MTLRRFWFEFDLSASQAHPMGVLAGCGVTAFSREDSLQLLRDRVFNGKTLPQIRRLIEDVDVSELDPGHVLPNMGNVLNRGVWFPLGYEEGR